MTITFRRVAHPDHPKRTLLIGISFLQGRHQMSTVEIEKPEDEKRARKLIKKAFKQVRDR
jgi:hypothetical protein